MTTTKSGRGGPREGAGRPVETNPVSKSIAIRFTAEELKEANELKKDLKLTNREIFLAGVKALKQ